MIAVHQRRRSIWRTAARAVAPLLSVFLVLGAAVAEEGQIGQITAVSGTVSVVRGTDRLAAKTGDKVYRSDVIETGADGEAGVTLVDSSRFSIGARSQVAVEEFQFDPATSLGRMTAGLRQGTLAVTSGEITHKTPGAMRIRTPTSILAVRGTTFGVEVIGGKERYVVFPNRGGGSGAISVKTPTAGAPARQP